LVGTDGKIGLIAVDSAAGRLGLGVALVGGALRWFASEGAERVDVVTQSTNKAAQKLYAKTGFALESVDLWYHLSPLTTQSPGSV
jgi:ribosomal protein S18 acetylase RimI-like enzyme